jgi:H/ACA ribonucleoprotein complex subunit 4
MLLRSKASTDPAHGWDPHERPVEELLRVGVVNLDKPGGPTSHQVAAWLKDALPVEKAGHGGTLDPSVTGVLPTALRDATRVVGTLQEASKEYVAVVETHDDVDPGDLQETLEEFQGPIYQTPPAKSAVKRRLRVRTVYEMEVLEAAERHALFRVRCEAGTYVRTLCTDVGRILGVGASMRDLRRTQVGPFQESDTSTLHDVKDAYVFLEEEDDASWLRDVVQPVEDLLAPLPQVAVRDSTVDAVCHGAELAVPGIAEVEKGIDAGDRVLVVTLKGEAVAVGEARKDDEDMVFADEGVAVETDRVVMEPGTYPKGWD